MPGRILERHVGGNTTYGRHLRAGLQDLGIEVATMPFGRSPAVTAALETGWGLRSCAAGDVLHFLADTGPLVRPRQPSVVTVHGVASRWISTARTPLQERTWRARVGRAIRLSDRLVTVSESSADDVAEVFDVDRALIHVIPHGIDVPVPVASEISQDVLPRLPDAFLLFLANIEPRKNLPALIEAMALPEVRALGLKLVIAGKPAWNAEESLRMIAASPDVVPLGFVSDEDRYHLMRRARAFVFPSLYEGFGFPVLEAMAVGTPVICSDRGSLAEVAGPSRRMPGVDPEGIAAGITNALADAEWMRSASDAGREWARRFRWTTSVARHVEVYESVAAS